jgi:hypothetical protein
MRYIVIGGVRYEWKEIRRLRRDQIQATHKRQLVLFEMKDDRCEFRFKPAGYTDLMPATVPI